MSHFLQYLNFTKDALQLIENSTALLFQSMVANEIARRFVSESISVELKKSEGNRLSSTVMETMGGGIIQTPSGRGVLGGKEMRTTNAVDLKVCPILMFVY